MKYMELRKEVSDICRLLWRQGWVAANDGNVSVKLPDGNFLATPTGISKRLITPEKLIIIDSDANVLEGLSGFRPTSEIKMHLSCYAEREDISAVVHAHPPTATGFAVANIALDRYSMVETVITMGSVPIVPYATPSTNQLPEKISPYLAQHDVLLLQNHGALTVGVDLLTAYYRMETLELFAKISLTANILGGEQEISQANIEQLIKMRQTYGVTGRHPGYKHYK